MQATQPRGSMGVQAETEGGKEGGETVRIVPFTNLFFVSKRGLVRYAQHDQADIVAQSFAVQTAILTRARLSGSVRLH